MATSSVKLHVITTFECYSAAWECTAKWFCVNMNSEVRLQVRLSWKTFSTYIAIKRFNFQMKSFVKAQQSLDLEGLRANGALKGASNGVDDKMCSHVLYGFEAFVTTRFRAFNVKAGNMSCLVSLQVCFLDERSSAKTTIEKGITVSKLPGNSFEIEPACVTSGTSM